MSKLIIAEKPSVAKSIASALGASSRVDGFYESNGLLVSWCVGHLVSPMDAGGYNERFKKSNCLFGVKMPFWRRNIPTYLLY
jgi:DNA topoisomerase-3